MWASVSSLISLSLTRHGTQGPVEKYIGGDELESLISTAYLISQSSSPPPPKRLPADLGSYCCCSEILSWQRNVRAEGNTAGTV